MSTPSNLSGKNLRGHSGWVTAEALVSLSLMAAVFAESGVQHRRTAMVLKQNQIRIDTLYELRGLETASSNLTEFASENLSIGCSAFGSEDSPHALNSCVIQLKSGGGPAFVKIGQPVIEIRREL